MTEFSALLQPDLGQPAKTLALVDSEGFEAWFAALPESARSAVSLAEFKGEAGQSVIVPGDSGDDWTMAVGTSAGLDLWSLSGPCTKLPEGSYRLATGNPGSAALGWLLAQDGFDAYRTDPKPRPTRVLLTRDPQAIAETVRLADAVALVRRLVNTPAADMGPAALEAEARAVAAQNDAHITITMGDALESDFPMIHAVGRAADRIHAPRLIELEWGDPKHPRIAIIGKGVCFDSGGLDIKPPSSMRLMKKDMGGAAHALSLAGLVMQLRLPVRLHLLVPAVENAISANAFRPGDILKSRKGLFVEIDNTDAEGRLVLADALTKAGERDPELVIDFATLTGAARTALGPDLPAMFANEDSLAAALLDQGQLVEDPCWRMPLWAGYADMLSSDVADTLNSSESGMAGCITAALFLQKFVPDGAHWAHFDTYAWRGSAKPGRPKGGEALGLRASWAMLKARYTA